jgi:hypothetical protein
MAKQTGYIKATGTVDDNVNFYYNQVDGFLVRLLPGVDSKRYWSDPAFEGSRRSAERFGVGNITSSIIYRFVPVKRRYRHLFKQVRTIAIVCLKQEWIKGVYLQPCIPSLKSKSAFHLPGSSLPFCFLPLNRNWRAGSKSQRPKR